MLKCKVIKLVLLLSVFFLAFIGLIGCGNQEKKVEQVLSEIKQNYFDRFVSEIEEKTVDDVIVNYYIGEYNGYFVLMLSYEGQLFFQWVTTVNFDEYSITYPNSNVLRAWKDGTFYELKELYDSGEISKNDIKEIIGQYDVLYAEKHNNLN